jgi:hypothetical protein
MTALAVVLSVIGGCCELAGLGLVALGIKRDRERARDAFAPRARQPRLKRSYPMKAMPRSYPGFPGSFARERDALRQIAEYVSKVDAATHNFFIDLQQAIETELDESVDRLRAEMADIDDVLRNNLLYVLRGSISERITAAGLLLVGIVLGVGGSVLGTLAS